MTDRSFGLFEPDALLPAQFYAAFRGGSSVRGEKRLMLAVLEDALDCFQKYAVARDGTASNCSTRPAMDHVGRSRMVLLLREHLRDAGDQPRIPASRLATWRVDVAAGTRPAPRGAKVELAVLQAAG